MEQKSQAETSDMSDCARKAWETPDFERYDVRRETQSKYATTIEFTTTTGPAS